MPPHLHPRSRMTTSLFTTTLMVSFLVVAAPHLIPCPVDPRTLADSADPTAQHRLRRRLWRRESSDSLDGETCNTVLSEERRRQTQIEDKLSARRECPVPKPRGLIGTVLGVGEEEGRPEGEESILKRMERTVCRPWGKGSDR